MNCSNHPGIEFHTRKHPDGKPGEVLLAIDSDDAFFEKIGWKSKRKGNRVQRPDGSVRFPVFIAIWEVRKSGYKVIYRDVEK